jgi:glycosyltransferase involved in cell wall biosynthesis
VDVLVVVPARSLSFVEQDLAILSRSFGVTVLSRAELRSRRRLLPAAARLLATRRFGLVFVWFADPYDTPAILRLARWFGVPSAVVVGGYELASLPALGYGALRDRRERGRVIRALAGADALLPTSQLLAEEIRALGDFGGRLRVIAPGIDCDFWRPAEAAPAPAAPAGRERLVVTVATIASPTWKVKGLDLFAACARHLPDARFAILGECKEPATADALRQLAGGNLEIPGHRLSAAELLAWYRRATVYAQLSRRESFGVALAEAMACECAPVAARTGALPWVLGDCGRLVAPGHAGEAVDAIGEALAAGEPCRAARLRVASRFDAGRRERELMGVVRALIASRGRTLPAEATA